ncbi:hypothetical protein B2J93_8233 [Marssonina coronariae]|uniref:Uncharacterized protein n=1 Tax=Diplocarpon coronariae TaxID=2795749 RepID=A0A218YTF4_9HELO|nr:hypothetical protein B2J93_8233 [Marssonina coronariae]
MSSYPAILQLSALAGFGAAYLSNSLIPASSDLQWRLPVAIRLGPGSILLVGTILAPETPRFLAEAGRLGEAEAEAVLAWWRGEEGWNELLERGGEEGRRSRAGGCAEHAWVECLGITVKPFPPLLDPSLEKLHYRMRVRCSRDIHVGGLHLRLVVPPPDGHLWAGEAPIRRGVHVWVCAGEGQSLLAPAGLDAVRAVRVPLGYPAAFPCAVTTGTQWLFQIVVAYLTALLLASIGWATYLLYALCCVVTAAWVCVAVPETRNVALGKHMDALFTSAPAGPESVGAEFSHDHAVAEEDGEDTGATALLGG